MVYEKWNRLLGLANRARKVISGEELVLKEIRNGRAKLVLLSQDASNNTIKKITNKCRYYEIPFVFVNDRYSLGQAIGKAHRVVVAVTDEGFASTIKALLD
ncbi:YlxQ family RNA-binding protein [Aeribacillus alveayuensis]|uniref:Ribosomal protein L7Ae-like RNA K-turn-binding protein n=1 Tax=Aeribacillus alveayuensis TaxID=279215 RepID=A0ABT9VLZ0_9BACI|nr:ribosomal protein L7Ae-like RNA K-turn-binding protein [Bacillus alveayuensis]